MKREFSVCGVNLPACPQRCEQAGFFIEYLFLMIDIIILGYLICLEKQAIR